MKKEYKKPVLGISHFSDNVCTAEISGITNGVELTEQAMKKKNVENIEKAALSVFSFVE